MNHQRKPPTNPPNPRWHQSLHSKPAPPQTPLTAETFLVAHHDFGGGGVSLGVSNKEANLQVQSGNEPQDLAGRHDKRFHSWATWVGQVHLPRVQTPQPLALSWPRRVSSEPAPKSRLKGPMMLPVPAEATLPPGRRPQLPGWCGHILSAYIPQRISARLGSACPLASTGNAWATSGWLGSLRYPMGQSERSMGTFSYQLGQAWLRQRKAGKHKRDITFTGVFLGCAPRTSPNRT